MYLRNILRTLQDGWRWVLLCGLLGGIVSLAVSLVTTPRYRATASFLIYPNPSLVSSRDVVTSLDTLGTESVSRTYLEIFNSRRVFQDTLDRLELAPALMDEYTARAVVTTGSNIELNVAGPNPGMAALLANNIGQNGIAYIKSIYQVFDIAFLDHARAPALPYAPQTATNALWSALAGLGLGVAVVLVAENLRAPLEAWRRRALSENQSGAFMLRHFHHLVEQELLRDPATSFALALIELEGLDGVASVLPAGSLSKLLHQVTGILRNQLRGNDSIGRWDDTTFAILMPETPATGAQRTLERIQHVLQHPIAIDGAYDAIQLDPCIGWTVRIQPQSAVMAQENAMKALDVARTLPAKLAHAPTGEETPA